MNNNAEQYDHIEAFLQGKLSPEAQSDFEAAMQRDTALAEAVELRRLEFEVAEALIANDIRAQMSRLGDAHPPDDDLKKSQRKGRARHYWWLFAALLCSVVFIIWRWPQSRQSSPELPTPDTPHQPVDTMPAMQKLSPDPPPAQGTKPKSGNADRQQALRLYQKPELGGLRSGETHTDPLADALSAWEKGDYNQAGRLASALSPQDPNYWKAQYIYAHAAFLSQQYTLASRLFTQISASKVMPWAEESDWYMLLALMADGRRASGVFEQQYKKIQKDAEHLYHNPLKNIR
jgi:hypothetical protein